MIGMLSIFPFGLIILSILWQHHLLLLHWSFMIHAFNGFMVSCDTWSHPLYIGIRWGSIIWCQPQSFWWDHLRYKNILKRGLNLNYMQKPHVSFSHIDHYCDANDYLRWFRRNSLDCYRWLNIRVIYIFKAIHETIIIDYCC